MCDNGDLFNTGIHQATALGVFSETVKIIVLSEQRV
jgi:hypothetical protein